jgi:hypothetical protein
MFKLIQSIVSPIKIVESRPAPGAEGLADAIRAGEFESVERSLGERQDHDLRLARLDTLARDLRLRPQIARWRARHADSYHASLIWGASGVHYAWAARGGSWKPQNYAEFQRRLGEAEAILNACAATNAKDPAPWAMLLPVAMGRELGVEETLRIFKEAYRRSGPSSAVGHAAVQAFAPKWGAPAGTLEKVVRSMCDAAPRGHRVHALPAEAAIELVVYRCRSHDQIEGGMFTMPDIAPLVSHAEQLWHQAPERKPGPLDAGAHSSLAFVHWSAGNTTLAAPHVKAIYPVFDDYPWGMSGDAAGAARRAVKECGV